MKGSQTQPQEAINTIATLLFAGTAVLLLIALWQALTFHLNKRTHKIFVDEIERLKANGLQQDVTPEARHVVEDLTGYRYDTLWLRYPARASKGGRTHLGTELTDTAGSGIMPAAARLPCPADPIKVSRTIAVSYPPDMLLI